MNYVYIVEYIELFNIRNTPLIQLRDLGIS